jgi:ADP-heptose:LPS heptosyltransferase
VNTILVDGMHGLGDNVHQRAVIRHLLAAQPRTEFWLKTPWPCLYHDLVGDRLHVVDPATSLRTQRKNSVREQARYVPPPRTSRRQRVSYNLRLVQKTGSVLGAMIRATLGHDIDDADFRLPVPAAWRDKADALIGRQHKPVMILRPLVERTEWRGCAARNPDPVAYAALYNGIRDRFFSVSLADLVPGVEDLVTDLRADICLHKGELDIEAIAGLMAGAALTFCSPGFAVPLSQAVGTPVITVFGGFECSRSFSYGHRFAPTLGIDPINPCQCFSHTHACDKRIDLPGAHADIEEFIADNVAECTAVVAGRATDRLERLAEALHE